MKSFRNILLLIIVISFSSQYNFSQELTYIQPDIGTPGFNTYVEFIAPANIKGFFGQDGFYLNNFGDSVRIELKLPEDENKIVIGPAIVSWDGRMISSQIFVKPDVIPNSYDWEQLTDEFKIELIVKVKYRGLTPPRDPDVELLYTFYIVKPWPAIVSSGGGVFGEGTLGKRSPRGGMIFENLKINGIYSVSTKDCDPHMLGNQGYLPCTIIVTNQLIGTGGSKAEISAAGGKEDDVAKTGGNGGPGGGGGGGKWVDRITSASGYDGGGGFTGGGKGGTNYPLSGNGNYRFLGEGSFGATDGGTSDPKRGFSINGVEPPFQNTYNWEAAGGGTGHPFGMSGINTDDGNTPTPPSNAVGYGGGSGWSQKKAGGAGSYATIGRAPTPETAGKIHGNKQIIPFAGGSGGASGNPEGILLNLDVDAGSGGGGGGALRVFAKYIDNIYINVNGGDGENGDNNAHGGGGSGGAVELATKSEIKRCQISAVGGNFGTNREGGEGYLRIDFNTLPEVVPLPGLFYQGISTDSTYKVYRDIERNYTGRTPDNSNCSLYRRLDTESQWTKMPNPSVDFAGAWSIKYTPTGNHKYEYFVLVRDDAGRGTGFGNTSDDSLHNFEPKQLMAQDAANIFVLKDAYPDLVAPDELSVNTICENETYDFDFVVKNEGMKDLVLSIDQSYFQNSNPRFALITPTANVTLPEGQSQSFKIRYTPDPSELYNIQETFMLMHNDTAGPNLKPNPFPITLKIDSIIYAKLTFISTADFGMVQIGKPKTSAFVYRNDGNVSLKITSYPVISAPFTIINSVPGLPATLAPSQSITFNIQYDPIDENINKTDFFIEYEAQKYACQDDITINIQGKGSLGVLAYQTSIDFGILNWCDPDTIDVMFQNSSTNPGDFIRIIDKPILAGTNATDFRIITDPTKQYPLTLNMQDAIQYSVIFSPAGKAPGKYTAIFEITTDLSGSESISIPITAEIAQFDVYTTPASLDFGDIYVGFDTPVKPLNLQNDGILQEHIKSVQFPAEMTLTRITGSDYLAPNGGLNTYSAKLLLMTGGNYTGDLFFTFDEPCDDVLLVPITAKGLLSEVTVIDTLDFGIRPPCAVNILRDIRFENNSPAPYVIIQGSEDLIEDTGGFFLLHATGLSQAPGVHDTINPARYLDAGQIIFDAREGVKGTFYAKYKVQVYQNGEYKDVIVVLKATIDPGSYQINNNPTVFDPTIINQKSQKTVEIVNTGRWNMKLTNLSIPSAPEFTILPNSVVGTTLATNQKVSFNIEFYPRAIGTFNAIINLEYSMDSCDYNVDIQLDAVGGKSRTLILRLPDTLLVEPDIDLYKIPVYARLKVGDDPISNYNIDTIRISFDRTLFFFNRLSNGKGNNHNIMEFVDSDRIISFSVNNLNLTTEEQMITELYGSTMLGSKLSTDIIFTKVVLPNDGEITEVVKQNGYLKIKICDEGGDRLLINNSAKPDILLVPNPATDNVNITAIMIEKGNYTLEIYDLLGKKTLIQTWTKPTGGKEDKLISFDATALSNGIYIIRLTAPSQIINKTLNITK